MIKRGITGSKLLSNLYEGNVQNVPIGQTPLTNVFEQNPASVYPQILGMPLTNRSIDDFEIADLEMENKAIKRNDLTNELEFVDATVVNDGKIVAIDFNQETGTVSIIKANGEIVAIEGLLTQVDFGVGKQGDRGLRGQDGIDGLDGDDGDVGDDGCEGEQGKQGAKGNPGAEGKDGAIGIPGPIGETGLDGLQGPVGKQGRFGHEGSRGRKGPSCGADAQGADGVEGEAPVPSVVISNTAPSDATVLLWGKPD